MCASRTTTAVLALTLCLPAGLARAEAFQTGQHAAADAASRWHVAQVAPDRLVVTRTKNNRNNPNAPSFDATIPDRSPVQKLYADIIALPAVSGGPRNCPNDSGISYHLDFYSGAAVLLAADYDPSGCASITLSDGTRKDAAFGSFRSDLSQALGFTSDRQLLGLP
jgi:hypothetical protein